MAQSCFFFFFFSLQPNETHSHHWLFEASCIRQPVMPHTHTNARAHTLATATEGMISAEINRKPEQSTMAVCQGLPLCLDHTYSVLSTGHRVQARPPNLMDATNSFAYNYSAMQPTLVSRLLILTFNLNKSVLLMSKPMHSDFGKFPIPLNLT